MLDELKELRRLIGKLMGYERTDALALIDQLVERFSANTQTIEALTKSNIDLKIPCGTTEYHRRLLFKANPVKQQDERPGYICLLPEILENEKACQLIAENVRFDEDIFRPEHVLWGEWLLLFGYSKQFLSVVEGAETPQYQPEVIRYTNTKTNQPDTKLIWKTDHRHYQNTLKEDPVKIDNDKTLRVIVTDLNKQAKQQRLEIISSKPKNLGYVQIPAYMLDNPALCSCVFATISILKDENVKVRANEIYLAESEHFKEVLKRKQIPLYRPITVTHKGKLEIHWLCFENDQALDVN